MVPWQDVRGVSSTSGLHNGAADYYWTRSPDFHSNAMKGLGYQLGKLLGTIAVTLSSLGKATYITVAIIGILCVLLYNSLPTRIAKPVSSSKDHLMIGGNAKVTNTAQEVNMRRTSGYQNKTRQDVITTVSSGQVVRIVAGPKQSDGLSWWLVRWDAYEGWMAEYNAGKRVLLEPT